MKAVSDISDGLFDIFRGAGIVLIGTIFGQGLGLLANIILAQTLLPKRFGAVTLSFTIVSMMSILVLLGTSKGVPRLISGDEPLVKKKNIIFSGYIISLSIGLVSSILLYYFAREIANIFGNAELSLFLRLFSVYLLIFPVAKISVSGLRGLELSKEAIFARNISSRVVALGAYIIATGMGIAYIGAVFYYITIQLTIAIVSLYFLHDKLFSRDDNGWIPAVADFRRTFSFSWPLAISNSFVLMMGNLDVLMIGYYLKQTQVGYYKAIQPLSLLLLTILSSFVFLFLPVASKHYKQKNYDVVSDLFSSTTKIISILTFPVALVFVLFSKEVVVAFYSESYSPAAFAFSVLTIGTFLRTFVGPNGAMIKVIDRTRIDLISSFVGSVSNILLNLLLIPEFGISGAALATSISFLVYNFIELSVIYTEIGSHPFNLNLFKPIGPTLIIGLIIKNAVRGMSLGILSLLIIGCLIFIAHITSVYMTGSFDNTDAILLKKIESKFGELPWLEKTKMKVND